MGYDDLNDHAQNKAEGRTPKGQLPADKKTELTVSKARHALMPTTKDVMKSLLIRSEVNVKGIQSEDIEVPAGVSKTLQMLTDNLVTVALSDFREELELECPDCNKEHTYKVPGANYQAHIANSLKATTMLYDKSIPSVQKVTVDVSTDAKYARFGQIVIKIINRILDDKQLEQFYKELKEERDRERDGL